MTSINDCPIEIFEHFQLLYVRLLQDEPFFVQLPNGMTNLKEIEDYVQRHIDAGLPSYKEVWSHQLTHTKRSYL